MPYLKTLNDADIFPKDSFNVLARYVKRVTVKAIVKDDRNRFAFITSPINGQYLLSGGGAESEDLEKEIRRECLKELGYEIEILEVIEQTQEFRNKLEKEYETTCFLAKATKKISGDFRTEDEKEARLSVAWFTLDEAKEILDRQVEGVKKGEIEGYELPFNITRDHLFFMKFLHDRGEA